MAIEESETYTVSVTASPYTDGLGAAVRVVVVDTFNTVSVNTDDVLMALLASPL